MWKIIRDSSNLPLHRAHLRVMSEREVDGFQSSGKHWAEMLSTRAVSQSSVTISASSVVEWMHTAVWFFAAFLFGKVYLQRLHENGRMSLLCIFTCVFRFLQ
ncbi:hypothetical protein PMAYCL1PPCAC_18963, partial [Pristionchus mayeri]